MTEQGVSYAAHLGWLDSKAKGHESYRRSELKDSSLLNLPSGWICSGLISAFEDAGKCKSTGMGTVGLDWSDILAWTSINKIDDPWLCSVVRIISASYANSLSMHNDKEFGSSPILNEYENIEVVKENVVTTQIKSVMSILKNRTVK